MQLPAGEAEPGVLGRAPIGVPDPTAGSNVTVRKTNDTADKSTVSPRTLRAADTWPRYPDAIDSAIDTAPIDGPAHAPSVERPLR